MRDDGGPAFPVPMVPWQGGFTSVEATGMTLRDYFAAKAMAALIAEPPWGDGHKSFHWVLSEEAGYKGTNAGTSVAVAAYRMADWMLAERSKA